MSSERAAVGHEWRTLLVKVGSDNALGYRWRHRLGHGARMRTTLEQLEALLEELEKNA